MTRDLKIAALTTAALLAGLLVIATVKNATQPTATEQLTQQGQDAMQRFHEAQREAERERQEKTDAML